MRTRGFLIMVVVGALVAGCGGGSSKAPVAAPTTVTKPAVAPNTPNQRAADQALAAEAVLKLTDFPLGWTAEEHKPSTTEDDDLPPGVEEAFVSCVGLPKDFLDDETDDQPNADSPDFSRGQVGAGPAAQIESSVEIQRSVKEISVPLARLADTKAAKCFDPFFRAIFAEGFGNDPSVTMTGFSFRSLSVGSIGDQAAAFQGRVSVVGPGASVPIEFNLYFVRVGRAIATFSAIAFSVPFDQAFAQKLLEKVVGRLEGNV